MLLMSEHSPDLYPPNITAENIPVYDILSTPELRAQYISLTDNIIYNIYQKNIDTVIYLDKSARPVAWMVDALWDSLEPPKDADGQPLQKPQAKFLNIDREQWGAIVGRSEGDGIDIGQIPEARINELQSVFGEVKGQGEGSMLKNKNVLIVDEVRVSGDTMEIAERIIARAFPEVANINSVFWMGGRVVTDPRTGVRKNTNLPVWYNDERVTGRLVADRDTTKSQSSPSLRQNIGRYWLSSTFRVQDKLGLALKREVIQMAEDLVNHRLPYMPATGWDMAVADERLERLNNGISVEEYALMRRNNPDLRNFVGAMILRNRN